MRPCVPKTVSPGLAFSFCCSELAFVFSGAGHRLSPVQATVAMGGGKFSSSHCDANHCTGHVVAGLNILEREGLSLGLAQPCCCCLGLCQTVWSQRTHSSLLPSPSPALSGFRGFTEHTLGNQKKPLTAWLFPKEVLTHCRY